ncbi:putative lipoprotein signal peptide [Lunatimonas lonarensis]|uniref:Putative lipoprotein signal peptide n=1 Tax=Lunatimonas lonarensis TaxID=1232681 RepID=R7ZR71_9BACT|nr:alpha/beta fold hydrolase [Lunatimonas lonarensis]EON76514.1 putative lipoprotein signal peptide [Lunatimonas lonarensis]
MIHILRNYLFGFVLSGIGFSVAYAQSADFVYGDLLPDAPELAARGEFSVGVRTVTWSNPNQWDIQSFAADSTPRYDRQITVEIWYPSGAEKGAGLTVYEDAMGINGDPNRPLIPFKFQGRSLRDAEPFLPAGPFPLVIVSHGFLGSRYLMSYLTENLASKGYVVVAIDHPESTFQQPGKFVSTLYYRALDDLYVLDQVAKYADGQSGSFLSGLVDVNRTALVGYSMGGYGVLNAAGAGYSQMLGRMVAQFAGGSSIMDNRIFSHPGYVPLTDTRVKAIVAFAPWGMQRGAWDEDGLKGVSIPTFLVAGDQDDISGYEDGVKAIYQGLSNSRRYMLVYQQARHNVAPNPPPTASFADGIHGEEYMRYAEPVWDERRINNINQHFLTAFLGIYLKDEQGLAEYLDLSVDSLSETWKGFKPRTSIGMQLHRASPE